MSEQIIRLSESAAKRIREILASADKDIVGVRVGVKSGGCAGMSYIMEYAKDIKPNEEVVEEKGVKVLIAPSAIIYLLGTEMDYKKEKFSSQFVFKNPNEKAETSMLITEVIKIQEKSVLNNVNDLKFKKKESFNTKITDEKNSPEKIILKTEISKTKLEISKIKKLYNVSCVNLKNGVSRKIIKFKKKKFLNFKYIIYCGSYKYLPNKNAIDYLVNVLMPKLNKKFPNLKLVLTGGGYEKNTYFFIECSYNFCSNFFVHDCCKICRVFYDRNWRTNWSLFPDW